MLRFLSCKRNWAYFTYLCVQKIVIYWAFAKIQTIDSGRYHFYRYFYEGHSYYKLCETCYASVNSNLSYNRWQKRIDIFIGIAN